jgi:hypothetical protein
MRVKGTAIVGLASFVEQRHGREGAERWLAGARPEDRALASGSLASSWYPIGSWNRLADAYVDRLGGQDPTSFRAVAEYTAARDLTTIFKILLKLATPTLLMQRSPSLWSRYFDVGEVTAEEVGPRAFVARIAAPIGIDEAPGPVTCAVAVTAWLARALRMTGAERPHVEERRCRHKRARACEIEIDW